MTAPQQAIFCFAHFLIRLRLSTASFSGIEITKDCSGTRAPKKCSKAGNEVWTEGSQRPNWISKARPHSFPSFAARCAHHQLSSATPYANFQFLPLFGLQFRLSTYYARKSENQSWPKTSFYLLPKTSVPLQSTRASQSPLLLSISALSATKPNLQPASHSTPIFGSARYFQQSLLSSFTTPSHRHLSCANSPCPNPYPRSTVSSLKSLSASLWAQLVAHPPRDTTRAILNSSTVTAAYAKAFSCLTTVPPLWFSFLL